MVDGQQSLPSAAQLEEQIQVSKLKYIYIYWILIGSPRANPPQAQPPCISVAQAEMAKLQKLQMDMGLASGVAPEPVGKGRCECVGIYELNLNFLP